MRHGVRDTKRGLFQAVFEELEREIVELVELAAARAPSVFEGIDPTDPEALTLLLSGAPNETALALAESPDRARARRLAGVALRRLLGCPGLGSLPRK